MAICKECGRKFHFISDPTKEEYICVLCKDKKIHMEDSNQEVIAKFEDNLNDAFETYQEIQRLPRCILVNSYTYNAIKRYYMNERKDWDGKIKGYKVYRSIDVSKDTGFELI